MDGSGRGSRDSGTESDRPAVGVADVDRIGGDGIQFCIGQAQLNVTVVAAEIDSGPRGLCSEENGIRPDVE